ncbi:uncharacterized protein LOC118484853 [Helianthus annuus]|uniref:uncharacterized protein LOC118484853 n=1 Tax=Helianthus annuus TaxID=4232 RepID=UPI0016533611|nr:uncharacterized protein LOC118484853 [Helianthus annuus]XP_035836783.1 uncharacterized protein LOC118484853 [Helianthus annuus]
MRRGCSSRCSVYKLIDEYKDVNYRLLRDLHLLEITGEDEENKDGNVNQWVALAVVQTYNPNAKCLVAVSIFLNACRKLRFLMLKSRSWEEQRKRQTQTDMGRAD